MHIHLLLLETSRQCDGRNCPYDHSIEQWVLSQPAMCASAGEAQPPVHGSKPLGVFALREHTQGPPESDGVSWCPRWAKSRHFATSCI